VQYNGIYLEINTGYAYHSFQNKIKVIGNSVIVPLIFSLMEQLLIMLAGTLKHQLCLHWEYLSNVWGIDPKLGTILDLLKTM